MELQQIEKIVDELLLRSRSNVSVKLEAFFPGDRFVGGKYNLGSHTITMYIEEIKNQCLRIFGSLDKFTEYFMVVFAHELGHAEDKELDELSFQLETCKSELEKKKIALKIEENAWVYARKITPEIDEPVFETIVFRSTESYRRGIELETA
ncbi:hypothetical protein CU633_02630 [Bacillus sp. V3-13]|nr:hypothetical protein [Bacillus sp. V3-13]PLR78981.1 hypothetical protein CU633_02630 [Bacillus sp. V3-13]